MSNTTLQRREKRRARHAARRQARGSAPGRPSSRGEGLVGELAETIGQLFPTLFEQLGEVPDCRGKSKYTMAEILMAAIALFALRQGSRNALNNKRQEGRFKKNYRKLFGLRLPHLDTVHRVLARLAEETLEELKHWLVKTLLERRALHRHRLFGRWFNVAIDATGMVSFSERHCEQCLHQTSKSGKTTYFHNVLEAKLVTANGLAISLATEWIVNPVGEYDKQDCERKAFTRLAAQLKQRHPRLPICLTADGLYPYRGFFEICEANGWRFIATFKDGSLPSVWEEVRELLPLSLDQRRQDRRTEGSRRVERVFRWVNDVDYHGHALHWIECTERERHTRSGKEEEHRFVHVTDLRITADTAPVLDDTGRLRWRIENEGFNSQKNHGCAMQHKYARVSWRAAKNYYQCLQIGHLISQLMIHRTTFQARLTGKMTCRHLWEVMLGFLIHGKLRRRTLERARQRRIQIRLA